MKLSRLRKAKAKRVMHWLNEWVGIPNDEAIEMESNILMKQLLRFSGAGILLTRRDLNRKIRQMKGCEE